MPGSTHMRSTWVLRIPGYGPTVPGPTLFDPTSIGSIVHRWRASKGTFTGLDGTGGTTSGDPVGTWTDEIGAIDLVAPSTSARPALATVGSTPTVVFDGTDDYLATSSVEFSVQDSASIVVITTFPGSGYIFDSMSGGNTRRVFMDRSGAAWYVYSSGRAVTAVAGVGTDGWAVMAHTCVDGDLDLYENAIVGDSDTGSGSLGIDGLILAASKSISGFAAVSIAEVLIFDKVLTAAQVRQIQDYAAETYGTDLSIPAASTAFDPSDYGTVISAHTARGSGYVDGASVDNLADISGNGRHFIAPSSSNEGVMVAAPPGVLFDVNDEYRAASRTPFDTLHKTATGTIVVRYAPTSATSGELQTFFATSQFSTSGAGVLATLDDREVVAGSNRLRLFVPRGVSGEPIYDTLDLGAEATLVAGEYSILTFAFDATNAHLYQGATQRGTTAGSGDTPSASASSSLPAIRAASGNFHLEGELSDVLIYSDKLDAADVAALVAALEAEYA